MTKAKKEWTNQWYLFWHSKKYRNDVYEFAVNRRYGLDFDIWENPEYILAGELLMYLKFTYDLDYTKEYKEYFDINDEQYKKLRLDSWGWAGLWSKV